jgi:hypothetical protein
MAARLEKQVLEFAMLSPAPAIVLVRKEPHER